MKTRILTTALLSLFLLAGCDDKKEAENKKAAPQQPAPVVSVLHTPQGWGTPASGSTEEAGFLARNYYVVFDGSGSMSESACSGGNSGGRIVPAREAMARFGAALGPADNLGLYVFDARGAGERVSLGSGQLNRALYAREVRSVIAGSGTPLGDALYKAYYALRNQSVRQNGYGEYHIVVVTDGEATDGAIMAKAVAEISKTPVILETIGFCIAEGHALNRHGQTVYRNAMNPAELTRGLEAVLAETETFSTTSFGASQ